MITDVNILMDAQEVKTLSLRQMHSKTLFPTIIILTNDFQHNEFWQNKLCPNEWELENWSKYIALIISYFLSVQIVASCFQ